MRSSGFQTGEPWRSGPTHYPTRELSGPGVLVRTRGARSRLRKPSSTTLVPLPRRPQRFPFQLVLCFRPSQGHCRARWDGILRRPAQKSSLSQRPHLFGAGLSQASAAPSPACTPAPSSLLVPPILTTWPTQYRWFGSGSCSCSSSSGVLVRLRAPDALQALIPCLLPSPPPFAASPAPDCGCRCRCRGRRGEGRMGRDAGWLGTAAGSGQLRPREREGMGAPLQPPWVPKCLRPSPARD